MTRDQIIDELKKSPHDGDVKIKVVFRPPSAIGIKAHNRPLARLDITADIDHVVIVPHICIECTAQ